MTDAESTPITGIGELATNDADDGTYATPNNAALVISGDRVAWTGPDSRAPAQRGCVLVGGHVLRSFGI